MALDDRLRGAVRGRVLDLDRATVEKEFHTVARRGRTRRRGRRLRTAGAVLGLVGLGVWVAPHALDAIRGADRRRPATPDQHRQGIGTITTVAGSGMARSYGDGGPAVDAGVRYPLDVATDADGTLYVLEINRVRKIDTSGRITTVVGPGVPGDAATPTAANRIHLGHATALAVGPDGDLYVGGGDGTRVVVNRIDATGSVTRIAGTGRNGYSGDGSPAVDAELGWVYDLAVDPAGRVYMTDFDHHVIRRIDEDGIITTIAGTGEHGYSGDGGPATAARLNHPTGIALGGDGAIYVADSWNNAVRRIGTDGVIATIAGTGEMRRAGRAHWALKATFIHPEHVAVDQNGNVYIEDTGNNCVRVAGADRTISTVVGTCSKGFGGDGGPAQRARLAAPSGMELSRDGILYIADSANDRVRRVVL